MTKPIEWTKKWEDHTLEERVERLRKVHDHNSLVLDQAEKRIEEVGNALEVALNLLGERVEKLEKRAKVATSAEVFQAIHEGGLEINLRKRREVREEDMDTLERVK